MGPDDAVTTETVDGLTVSTYWDPDAVDPVRDYDHAGQLITWEDGPCDGRATLTATGSRRMVCDWGRFDDPEGYARELVAETCAAGGVAIPVRYDDFGSGGSRFHDVDKLDDANGVWLADAETIATEWGAGERADALAYGAAFIAEVGAWVAGEVFGYAITAPSGDTVGGCWGFIGADPWKADDYMRQTARDEAKAIAEDLAADTESPDLAKALAAARTMAAA